MINLHPKWQLWVVFFMISRILGAQKKVQTNSIDLHPSGGERGIRTPGTLPYNGFQDRRIRPLCHFSEGKDTTKFRFGKEQPTM